MATCCSFVRETGRDGREAAIDVGNFAGDCARQVGKVEDGDVADFIDRDIAP